MFSPDVPAGKHFILYRLHTSLTPEITGHVYKKKENNAVKRLREEKELENRGEDGMLNGYYLYLTVGWLFSAWFWPDGRLTSGLIFGLTINIYYGKGSANEGS